MASVKTAAIRQLFVDYFKGHAHQHLPGSSLVPHDDPTLLFTNAGMVQFKDIFLGHEQPTHKRVVTVQRCVRAGGKHNDLENVGFTARHHTFFEMLGNFSFGDYFKREAIAFAWTFLTDVLKLPAEKLWVTVYEDDPETEAIWFDEIGIDRSRFSRCGAADNFWSMGDVGPCGPCSEIFYDHGSTVAGGPPGSPLQEGDRYVEIWNMVFMQYNRTSEGKLLPLPKTAVDTGMGLERIAAVMQGVHSNYDIDLFQYLMTAAKKLSPQQAPAHASLCVLADHIRSACFLISDGVMFSNEGRGYVLRRIVRRAIRHGHALAIPTPFFYRLVASLVDCMGDAYPELAHHQDTIVLQLKREEEQFVQTLARGLKVLQDGIDALTNDTIPGDLMFELYDTYGFPVDLSTDVAREQGMHVDMQGFDAAMAAQKERSKRAHQFAGGHDAVLRVAHQSKFIGYDSILTDGTVLALLDHEACELTQLEAGQKGMVVLDQTPFYAEAGGQVGDRGVLRWEDGQAAVTDTQKSGKAIVHHVQLAEGHLAVGDVLHAEVDARRELICCHHSATHLLHASLRAHLGEQVVQKGSLVRADRLRFDFSYDMPVSQSDLDAIERSVNACIRANVLVQTEEMSLADAKDRGVMMLFGERYADRVRVLTMGDFSAELCGGTHVRRTGDMGYFRIVSESGVASGIRRIEAVVAAAAVGDVQTHMAVLALAAKQCLSPSKDLPEKINQQHERIAQLEQSYAKLMQRYLHQYVPTLLAQAAQVGQIKVVVAVLSQADMGMLRELVDALRAQTECVIFLVGIKARSLHLLAASSTRLSQQYPANALMREVASKLGGKGGGRADLAQGGASGEVSLDALKADVLAWFNAQHKL